MIKSIFTLLLFVVCTPLMADSCYGLYAKKEAQIRKDNAYTTSVGAHLFVLNNQLAYNPGIQVPGRVDNWAGDFVDAIKWGPFYLAMSDENPRRDWLEAFRKSISHHCDLPKDDYRILQAMLNELMEDGSFCPQNKILEPSFLKGKKEFKKILQAAVKDQRFPENCKKKAVVDDSAREIKNTDAKTPEGSESWSTQQ